MDTPDKKLSLTEYGWVDSDTGAIQLTTDGHDYFVVFILWIDDGTEEGHPIIMDTKLGGSDLKSLCSDSAMVLHALTRNVLDTVLVFDDEGEMIDELSLNELLGDEQECAPKGITLH